MSFTDFNFNKHISEALKSQGYVTPTPIQQRAIQPTLDGRDMIGLAQTGTGKTAAFVLPILEQLSAGRSSNSVRSLIIAPTRELAEQTYAYIGKFSRRLKIRACVVYGGVSREAQINKLKRGVDIVVACPGRLLDLANDGAIKLSGIEILVLDEADQMLDQGFLPDIKRIIKKLPVKRQNLVFSATMPHEVRSLIDGLLVNPVEVTVDHTEPHTNISHTFYRTEKNKKNSLLTSILKEGYVGSAIVFTRTKYKAKSLAQRLEKQGFKAASIQGNLSQQQRQRALNDFKNGSCKILVATDIAARGIDVAGISHIINYDIPGTTEAYTHRTGRTGRACQSGEALTFITSEDQKMIKSLERVLRGKITYGNLPSSDSGDVVFENRVPQQNRPARPASPASPAGIKSKKTLRKVRGKRSSQRNRMAAFDFGV